MKLENTPEAQDLPRPGKRASHLRLGRRTFAALAITVVVIVAVLITSIVVVSTSAVSRLTITLFNNCCEDIVVRVWVDEFKGEGALLEPQESVSFHWDITGWPIHRYDILWHPPDMLVSHLQSWTYTLVVPFTERTIWLDVGWS